MPPLHPDPRAVIPGSDGCHTIACPSCGERTWRIEYVEEIDAHRYICAGCGVPLVLKRWRDLD